VKKMPKMTKAQAKKRLKEARAKLLNVFVNFEGMFTKSDTDKMVKMLNDLNTFHNKLK
tara:strand:- start:853 stop:1026 length:174 start_codon:yes stop_codon:yes gene_type:complete